MKLLAYSKWDKRKNPVDAQWGLIEIAILGATIAIGFVLGWKFWLYFLPFYYLGHCCTYLNGFFFITGATPTSRSPGTSVRTTNGTTCFGSTTVTTSNTISGRSCTGPR